MKTRSKNDAYYSYRWRCEQKNKTPMSLSNFIKSRQKGEKTKDGKFKPDWITPGKRTPLMWLKIYNTIPKINRRRKFLLEKLDSPLSSIRKSQYQKQLEIINLLIEAMKE